jgi:hypothetical protein
MRSKPSISLWTLKIGWGHYPALEDSGLVFPLLRHLTSIGDMKMDKPYLFMLAGTIQCFVRPLPNSFGRDADFRLQSSQRHFLDHVTLHLLQDEVGALAGRQDVLVKVEEIDSRPDRARGRHGLIVGQRRVAVKV